MMITPHLLRSGSWHGGPFIRPRSATIAQTLRAAEGDLRHATRFYEARSH